MAQTQTQLAHPPNSAAPPTPPCYPPPITHAQLFLGSLRDIEQEMIRERLSSAVMESLLALTIFREEFSAFFVAMFASLVFIKVGLNDYKGIKERALARRLRDVSSNTRARAALTHPGSPALAARPAVTPSYLAPSSAACTRAPSCRLCTGWFRTVWTMWR